MRFSRGLEVLSCFELAMLVLYTFCSAALFLLKIMLLLQADKYVIR